MRYDNPTLREHLASTYALGSLRGLARLRFERLMRDDAALRALVVDCQEMLTPLALGASDVTPPAAVRSRLAKATSTGGATSPERGLWQRLSSWRALAAFNGLVAAALLAVVGLGLIQPAVVDSPELVYVGVLSDRANRPALAVLAYNRPFRLSVESKLPLSTSADREFRVWIRDSETDAIVFLASIPPGQKTLVIEEAAWRRLKAAKALLVTEAMSGSPTDAPTGDILFEGVCVNLKKWSEAAEPSAKP
ncbi:anti-sigma factor [Nitrogeniibacter aestuarii]|uniref:anti-sigma factor n=1 Tax=Nitrogeniibacter aestuarii TaxID=2815343 RepID=UPI001D11BC9E|nr:anti-sigma factor [Nitrogeniibacter aestuarii]